MGQKLKDIGYGVLGYGFVGLSFLAITLLVAGGVQLFEALYPILEGISTVTWSVVWLLLLLSVVPRFRNFTGSGMVLGTYIGGAIFWLFCFYTTYQLWGFLGIFVGVLFPGLGVFITAVLALMFDDQFMGALGFSLVLGQIFLFRFLGHWIISKHRGDEEIATSDLSKFAEDAMSPALSYCGQCGHKLDDESQFCSNCGIEV